MTSGAVPNVAYQSSQLPLAAPISGSLALVEALMKTSPCLTLPLMSLTSAVEPAPVPSNWAPVALSKAGPMPCSIRLASEPAYRTCTLPLAVIFGADEEEVAGAGADDGADPDVDPPLPHPAKR